ncbi:MAG: hypothetical protein HRT44_05435, partial [Bdellovibrionales bacterium]|nr:hypothetical protein [Bdellovibrionales bacterium]
QNLLQPNKEVISKMTIVQKKKFLEKHRVMITNLVDEIVVPNSEANDPSDTILFKAQKLKRIKFKKLSPQVKELIETTPKFFTSRYKKGIKDLMTGYLETNNLDINIEKKFGICRLLHGAILRLEA